MVVVVVVVVVVVRLPLIDFDGDSLRCCFCKYGLLFVVSFDDEQVVMVLSVGDGNDSCFIRYLFKLVIFVLVGENFGLGIPGETLFFSIICKGLRFYQIVKHKIVKNYREIKGYCSNGTPLPENSSIP